MSVNKEIHESRPWTTNVNTQIGIYAGGIILIVVGGIGSIIYNDMQDRSIARAAVEQDGGYSIKSRLNSGVIIQFNSEVHRGNVPVLKVLDRAIDEITKETGCRDNGISRLVQSGEGNPAFFIGLDCSKKP